MDSEFYVQRLVLNNQEACDLVSEYLGYYAQRKPEDIASQLAIADLGRLSYVIGGCRNSAFEEIRRLLDKAQGINTAQTIVTAEDLRFLPDRGHMFKIAGLLKCDPLESFQALFSNEELAKVIIDAGIATAVNIEGKDCRMLLNTLLSPTADARLTAHLATSDRFSILQRCLNSNARASLAEALTCEEGEALRSLMLHLKGVQRESTAPHGFGPKAETQVFDYIGLSKLRHLVQRVIEDLLDRAMTQASQARAGLPGHRSYLLLPVLIGFHLRRHFRPALTELLSKTLTLRRMGVQSEVMPLVAGMLPLDTRLEVIVQSVESGVADVSIRAIYKQPSGEDMDREVLSLTGVDYRICQIIKDNLPKNLDAFTATGDFVGNRVMDYPLPLVGTKKVLREALRCSDDSDEIEDWFVRYMVLSGIELNPSTIVPEMKVNCPPQLDGRPESRVEFPMNAGDIATRLHEDCKRIGKTVRELKFDTG